MIEVELHDGRILEFPDGTADAVIDKAVRSELGLTNSAASSATPTASTPEQAPQKVTTEDDLSWGEVASGAVKNFIPSAGRAIGETWDAITNPGDTLKNLGNVAMGYGAKLIPGRQDVEKYADAVNDAMAERYGGADNIKRTLRDDPFGLLADASSVFTGGAGLTRSLAKGASLANKAGLARSLEKVGDASAKAAAAVDPLTWARKGAGLVTPSPERLYGSALKPSTTMPKKDRERAIKVGIEERILPTKGLEKAERLIDETGQQIMTNLDNADFKGYVINPAEVEREARRSVVPRFEEQVAPSADLRDINAVLRDFRRTTRNADGSVNLLSPQQAQRKKQGTYRVLKDKAYTGEQKSARIETEKALASSLRRHLERVAPEVKGLNQKQGALVELAEQIRRAAGRTGNWELLGSMAGHTGLGATLGGALAGPTGALIGAGLGLVARDPSVKATAAFGLDALRKSAKSPLAATIRPQMAANYLGSQIGLLDLLAEEDEKKKK